MTPVTIIIAVVLLGGSLIFLRSGSKEYRASRAAHHERRSAEREKRKAEVFSPEAKAGGENAIPDTGELKRVGKWWLLNPKSPFPLHIKARDEFVARELKATLEDSYSVYSSEAVRMVMEVMITNSIVCKEVEEYVKTYKTKLLSKLESISSDPHLFTGTTGRDTNKIRKEIIEETISSFDIQPYCKISDLLIGHKDSAEEAEQYFKKKYGRKTTAFYLSMNQGLHYVPIGDPDREAFEELTERDLAAAGRKVDPVKILEALEMEEIRGLVKDLSFSKFRDKDEAINAVVALPNIKERLSDVVKYKEIFEILPPPVDSLISETEGNSEKRSFDYEAAKLVTHTYLKGGEAVMERADYKRMENEAVKGWKIIASKSCCQHCYELSRKRFRKEDYPKTPVHVGCRCSVSLVY